jgi:acetoacetyl-CoA synthetase
VRCGGGAGEGARRLIPVSGGSPAASAYYDQHPGVGTHGDWITIHHDGSCVITGQSGATLNRGGVRLGTAEMDDVLVGITDLGDSLIVHLEDGDQRVLFVVTGNDVDLDEALRERIRVALRNSLSPRHAPDRIHSVTTIPRTLPDKRVEVLVKRTLQGVRPDNVINRASLRNPAALDEVISTGIAWNG